MKPKKIGKLCKMCLERPAKPLTAVDHDGKVFCHAEKVVMFCTKKCAANYALLWTQSEEDS